MKCYYDQQIFMIQGNGGVSRYFFELIQRVGAAGDFEPTFFAGFYGSKLPLHAMRGCRVLGVRRFKVGPLWPLVTRGCKISNRLLLRGLAPAIYHPTYYRPATPPEGTRLVVTVYDMIHEKFPHLYPGDETAGLKRAACTLADAIICISESTRQDLLNECPEFAEKTSVVHLAAGPDFHAGQTRPNRPAPVPPRALFVGSRRDYKGFDLALDAWGQLASAFPELRLVCVGGGEFTASERVEIQRRGLGAKVSQQTATDARLAELYRGAAVLIYPSRYEGFGLPILEAMACGCPVVCSRSSSLPEVGGEAARYFTPGDASELAAALAEVLGDTTRRMEMARAGHERHRRFSWDECARKTTEIYRRCLAERRPA